MLMEISYTLLNMIYTLSADPVYPPLTFKDGFSYLMLIICFVITVISFVLAMLLNRCKNNFIEDADFGDIFDQESDSSSN